MTGLLSTCCFREVFIADADGDSFYFCVRCTERTTAFAPDRNTRPVPPRTAQPRTGVATAPAGQRSDAKNLHSLRADNFAPPADADMVPGEIPGRVTCPVETSAQAGFITRTRSGAKNLHNEVHADLYPRKFRSGNVVPLGRYINAAPPVAPDEAA